MRAGFPHSDITGSKLLCQLPHAFRRLARPSSPVIAKASTTCTYSLDPITLGSFSRACATGLNRLCAITVAGSQTVITRCNHIYPYNRPLDLLYLLLQIVKERTSCLSETDQDARYNHLFKAGMPCVSLCLVELVGIEPTTLGLQSRCSPS